MTADITEAQKQMLAAELEALSRNPGDEAHIQFQLAYGPIRKRHLLEMDEGGPEPPSSAAIEEATLLVRGEGFPDFTPIISNDDIAVRRRAKAQRDDVVINAMLGIIHSVDPVEATHLKWDLIPEEKKNELRQRYEQAAEEKPVEELIPQFKQEIDFLHDQREPQREQRQDMGPEAASVPGQEPLEDEGTPVVMPGPTGVMETRETRRRAS